MQGQSVFYKILCEIRAKGQKVKSSKGQKGIRAKGQKGKGKFGTETIVENQEKHYYLKLEDFKILPMFGECAIDVTNSKVKIELDKNKKRWWKKNEVRK